MRYALLTLAMVTLVACKEEVVQDTSAIPLTEEAVGHYCQMNLLEHDGPKAQAHLQGLPGAPLFFSQVRDAVAYIRMPEQSHAIMTIWVNDM
ncbi:MAG: nitrous oxide reductase accessory protein NosL, partial [Rhodobacteraceae bacterium]|nr:nitrous oxide reductase accessory protein NosL [Paracoccaceae bacterium]